MSIRENLPFAIMTLFPYAIQNVDFVVRSSTEGQYIAEWNLPSPQPTYVELEQAYLVFLKKSQEEVLLTRRDETITDGFISLSTGFIFGFDPNDQDNFTQQSILLLGDSTILSVEWKTKDGIVHTFTRDQFLAIIKEGEEHKKNAITKFWNLKAQIDQATSIEEVENIKWDS